METFENTHYVYREKMHVPEFRLLHQTGTRPRVRSGRTWSWCRLFLSLHIGIVTGRLSATGPVFHASYEWFGVSGDHSSNWQHAMSVSKNSIIQEHNPITTGNYVYLNLSSGRYTRFIFMFKTHNAEQFWCCYCVLGNILGLCESMYLMANLQVLWLWNLWWLISSIYLKHIYLPRQRRVPKGRVGNIRCWSFSF